MAVKSFPEPLMWYYLHNTGENDGTFETNGGSGQSAYEIYEEGLMIGDLEGYTDVTVETLAKWSLERNRMNEGMDDDYETRGGNDIIPWETVYHVIDHNLDMVMYVRDGTERTLQLDDFRYSEWMWLYNKINKEWR
jgi:hypothetical protein